MNSIEKLRQICKKFIEKEHSVKEFQSRLEQVMFPDELEREFEKIITDTANRLEEIRFTSLEANQYKYAVEVAKDIQNKVDKYNC